MDKIVFDLNETKGHIYLLFHSNKAFSVNSKLIHQIDPSTSKSRWSGPFSRTPRRTSIPTPSAYCRVTNLLANLWLLLRLTHFSRGGEQFWSAFEDLCRSKNNFGNSATRGRLQHYVLYFFLVLFTLKKLNVMRYFWYLILFLCSIIYTKKTWRDTFERTETCK
jgi:hypothetical protein